MTAIDPRGRQAETVLAGAIRSGLALLDDSRQPPADRALHEAGAMLRCALGQELPLDTSRDHRAVVAAMRVALAFLAMGDAGEGRAALLAAADHLPPRTRSLLHANATESGDGKAVLPPSPRQPT
ncbi:hypothetical protein CFN78_17995 [Amycolatopsis antarctica]|uniref:Uncharacterized protein n=1 Tax=Amycolatopsis antarctica TaxID=1854586 RepID=A0A263D3U0_9PSEU|nr:hypothetical protein [Amycolatopsis antarctica]OZM72025.1 hypothetical protein CFN78_17995 [Amycolatopsis antarctica]